MHSIILFTSGGWVIRILEGRDTRQRQENRGVREKPRRERVDIDTCQEHPKTWKRKDKGESPIYYLFGGQLQIKRFTINVINTIFWCNYDSDIGEGSRKCEGVEQWSWPCQKWDFDLEETPDW